MKKITSNLVGFSVLALAASIVGVGVVWAGSAALRDETPASSTSTVDSVPPDEVDGELPPVGPDEPSGPGEPVDIDDLVALVREIDAKVDALSDTVAASSAKVDRLESRVDAVREDVDDVDARATAGLAKLDGFAADIARARSDATDALEAVTGISGAVAVLERRTAKLSEEGNYGGPVNPSQLTRRLTPADLSGDWPLDRVTGQMGINRLTVSLGGCWSDSRYNSVLAVSPFRDIECLRIPK